MLCDILKSAVTIASLINASGEDGIDKDAEDELLIQAEEKACELSRVTAVILQAIVAGIPLTDYDPLSFINNYAASRHPAGTGLARQARPPQRELHHGLQELHQVCGARPL